MTYTLLKFLGWGILLAVIGGCVGWALRSLTARRDVARARAANVEADELERMRHRLANLEQVVAERDRLRMQIADMRHTDSPGVVGAAPDGDPATTSPESGDAGSVPTDGPPPVATGGDGEEHGQPGRDVGAVEAETSGADGVVHPGGDDGAAGQDDARHGVDG